MSNEKFLPKYANFGLTSEGHELNPLAQSVGVEQKQTGLDSLGHHITLLHSGGGRRLLTQVIAALFFAILTSSILRVWPKLDAELHIVASCWLISHRCHFVFVPIEAMDSTKSERGRSRWRPTRPEVSRQSAEYCVRIDYCQILLDGKQERLGLHTIAEKKTSWKYPGELTSQPT